MFWIQQSCRYHRHRQISCRYYHYRQLSKTVIKTSRLSSSTSSLISLSSVQNKEKDKEVSIFKNKQQQQQQQQQHRMVHYYYHPSWNNNNNNSSSNNNGCFDHQYQYSLLFKQQQQQQQQRWASSSSSSSNNNNNNKKNNTKNKKSEAMKRQQQNMQEEKNPPSTTLANHSSSFTVDVTKKSNDNNNNKENDQQYETISQLDGKQQQQGHFQLSIPVDNNNNNNNNNNSDNVIPWETDKKSKIKMSSSTSLSSTSLSSLSTSFEDSMDIEMKQSMFDPKIHLPHAPQDWTIGNYEPATPLSDMLMQRIGVSGKPITIAEYMKHALTHPLFGYYTSQTTTTTTSLNGKDNSDNEDDWDGDDDYDTNDPTTTATTTSKIFGRRGDFITAPEISHVFGHCICVWFMTQWKELQQIASSTTSSKKGGAVQLVEMGPGRGTLMMDILQLALTTSKEKKSNFGQCIHTVHFIETSKELRQQQQMTLENGIGHLVKLEFSQNDFYNKITTPKSTAFATAAAIKNKDNKNITNNNNNNHKNTNEQQQHQQTIRIVWHDDFISFQHYRDKDIPVMMVLQEFLDALPIHVFQMTDDGWRERLIDVVEAASNEEENDDDSDEEKVSKNNNNNNDSPKKPIPRLRQVLAPDVTPAVELLLSNYNNNNNKTIPVGTVVEICPDALLLIQDMVKVMEESGGVALIIDYGEDGTSDTLRAFSKHQQVPLTSLPGQVDVTADVDFFALRQCVEQQQQQQQQQENKKHHHPKIHAFGPVTQGEFLMRMGAGDMVIHSIEQDETTEEQAQKLYDALQFLVMPEHMGKRYKVLSLAPKRDGIFAPPGMET